MIIIQIRYNGSLSFLQEIFPTQRSNPGLTHCRQILCQLIHREAQEYWGGWAIPSLVDLPNPGIEPGSPVLQTGGVELDEELKSEP